MPSKGDEIGSTRISRKNTVGTAYECVAGSGFTPNRDSLFAITHEMDDGGVASEGRILVVEDDRDLAHMLEYNLIKSGYTTMTALDGLTACRMIEEEQPDLILLDLMLPGLNGWEICRIVRSHKREEISESPIIMLTALGAPENKLKGLELGADDYIPKPFTIKEVLLKVARLVRKKRTHQQLNIRVRELESRGNQQADFQNMLFHELRNQLMVIRGFSSRMAEKDRVFSLAKYQSYAGIVKRSSDYLGCLAEDMLLLSRLETGNYALPLEEVCLEEVVQAVILLFSHHAKEMGITIRFERTGQIPRMRLNLVGLKACLSSLIENAVKYSPENKHVSVNLLCQGERTVVLEVIDDGPGIPDKEKGQVFNRFYRGENVRDKTKGTGLGLYITKTLVEAMGGSIRVESRSGAGSCFRIEFKHSPEIQNDNPH